MTIREALDQIFLNPHIGESLRRMGIGIHKANAYEAADFIDDNPNLSQWIYQKIGGSNESSNL